MVRAHVFFSGTVQGVGFRYTTQRFARELNIQGWVKNLPDGRVEMMAEGPKERVHTLLDKLERYFGSNINHKTIAWFDRNGSFTDFLITH